MTVAATPTVNSFVGTGGASSYSFSFLIFSSADLTITVTSPTGTIYNLILGTDYTVSTLNPVGGPPTTGSITLVNSSQAWLTGGNLTFSWTIQISRVLALSQLTSIRNQGDFYPETIEAALDYLTMICQQLQQALNVSVPQSLTVVTGDITFSTGGAGVILTDQTTGKQYRLMVQSGILGAQPLP